MTKLYTFGPDAYRMMTKLWSKVLADQISARSTQSSASGMLTYQSEESKNEPEDKVDRIMKRMGYEIEQHRHL